jgi:hypothetical protein
MKTQVFRDAMPRNPVKCTNVSENHAASIVRIHTDDVPSRSLSNRTPLPDYPTSHPSRPQSLVISDAPGRLCAVYYKTSPRFQQNYEGICIKRMLIWTSLSHSLATHNESKQRQSNVTFKNKGKFEICVKRYAK